MLRLTKTGNPRQIALPILNTHALRIAELSGRNVFADARGFAPSQWHELAVFGPNVVAGSSSELQRLIERIDLRTVDLPSLDHAIFVVTELGDKPLTDALRVVLWQRFGVPVYEMYVAPDRRLLAHECEALDGWHVDNAAEFFVQKGQLALQTSNDLFATGLTTRLETAPCPCGRPGPRIVPPFATARAPKLVASA